MKLSLISRACLTAWFTIAMVGSMAMAQEGQSSSATSVNVESLIPDYASVTDERLQNPEPENWLIYKGSYSQQGYSPLDQINASNVSNLVPVWTYSTGETAGHEGAPIVNNGVMFATGAYNTLFALDAATGNQLWSYRRDLPQDVYPEVCCGVVNRGVALYGNNVYMATLDSHLLAFDAGTGKIVWDSTVADYTQGYAMTLAPLAVNGKIIVGVAGGEYGIRGFIEAFDAQSGTSDWKTYTTAAPDEAGGDTWVGDTYLHGGAPIWVTGSFDPSTNLTYWGTGNGGPWMGQVRPGDNLYVSSVLALDVNTGQIESHYQYVPNDSWDYDEISDQTLVTVNRDGKVVNGLIHAGRDGMFYLLDRDNDLKFIYGVPFTRSGLTISGFDADGRPVIPENRTPAINKPVFTCPAIDGGNNWFGLSYDPDLGYAFVPTTEWCMNISGAQVVYQAGQDYSGANYQYAAPEGSDASSMLGALQAIDVATGEVAWRVDQQLPLRSAVLSTKGKLVFTGDSGTREFRAFDATSGEELWHFATNSRVIGVPTSFEVDGVQYIAVESGIRSMSYNVAPAAAFLNVPYDPPQGGVIWVFALKDQISGTASSGQGQ